MTGWTSKNATLVPGKSHVFKYDYPGDKEIVSVKASCGCSAVAHTDNHVAITYSGCKIPMHLRTKGNHNVRKTATITFKDNSTQVIEFNVTCLNS